MSGDVQPRKRKDKRKKKEGGSLGMTHEPVASHKFRRSDSDDQKVFDLPDQGEKIHVQNEHGIGGNICVKIIFFCLFGLLIGAVSLIYLKSQGSSDVDLPTIEESRFADYFTGWLDDSTDDHEHEAHENSINHEHDDHEEQDDHDEHDEHDDHDDHDEDHEEADGGEENEHEEEGHGVEQVTEAIFKFFAPDNDDTDEVQDNKMKENEVEENEVEENEVEENEVEENEDSGIENDVDEDEDNKDDEDNGDEAKEDEKEEDEDHDEEDDDQDEDENEGQQKMSYRIKRHVTEMDENDADENELQHKMSRRIKQYVREKDDDDDDDDDDQDEDKNEGLHKILYRIKRYKRLKDEDEDENESHHKLSYRIKRYKKEEDEDDEGNENDESNEEQEDEDRNESTEKEKDEEEEEDEDEEPNERKEQEKDEEEDEEADENDSNYELVQQDEDDDNYNASPEKDESEMDEDEEYVQKSQKKVDQQNKISVVKHEDDDDDNINEDNEDSKEQENNLESEETEDEEQEQSSDHLKADDDLGYEEIEVSEEDLDDEPATTPDEKVKDETTEESETFTKKENEESKFAKPEETEEETEVDTGGVAIKLGVGIALIIVAHLVLVQKWKSVSNAASDEKASIVKESASEKKIEELHSSDEHVISRRQTLIPENVLFEEEEEEEEEEEDMEDDDEREGEEDEEEEDLEENEEKEYYNDEEPLVSKQSSWSASKEPSWKIKEEDSNRNFVPDEELEDEEDEEEDENEEDIEDEEVEEEGQDEDVEDEEYEEEEQDEDVEDEEEEEEIEEEDDEVEEDDEDNDFRRKKALTEENEEMSSQEELKEPTPVPPPRARRDGRGAQDVDEEPLNHFEEFSEPEETSQDYPKAEESTTSSYSEPVTQKSPEREVQEEEWSYRQELEFADEQFENNPKAAVEAYNKVISKKPTLKRALIGRARALDHWAEKEKSNTYLKQAIDAYKTILLNHGDLLDDETYVKLAERCIERIRFAGSLVSAIEVHKALIMKYPDTPKYRNMLAVTYLMMNKIPQARVLLNETLSLWPGNGFALVHYGFILKTSDNNMEEGAEKLMAGIETKEEGVINGMFFFHLGDALHRLGRGKEAMKWYELGVREGLFLSKYQRSLYNVNRLKGQPWWTKEDTTYQDFFKKLENNWREIRKEGLELLNSRGINLFKDEAENLKDTGDWKQLDLYFRGKRTPSCNKAPVTCSLVSSFQPAATCTRGQIKFSVMLPNTHVWPHCGPTNCRLRSHLGLVVPKGTFIRVAEETRSWEEGKIIVFDDSFEHEVWHNGTGPRLVLIVDVWHPELTNQERRQLSPI